MQSRPAGEGSGRAFSGRRRRERMLWRKGRRCEGRHKEEVMSKVGDSGGETWLCIPFGYFVLKEMSFQGCSLDL